MAARPPSFSAAKPLGVGTLNGSRRASRASSPKVDSICAAAAWLRGTRTTQRRCWVSWTNATS